MPEHGQRTGSVFLRNYHEALKKHLGATVDPELNKYFLTVPGLSQPKVQVITATPEQTVVKHNLPCIIIRRESFEADLARWQPLTQEYMVPAERSELIESPLTGETGVSDWELKLQTWPYNISYSIEIRDRYQNTAEVILRRVMARRKKVNEPGYEGGFEPYFDLLVKDNLDQDRRYVTFTEGFSDIDDLTDLVDREYGFSISVRIEGELDLREPEVYPSVIDIIQTFTRK